MKRSTLILKALVFALAASLCVTPELGFALQQSTRPQDQPLQNQSELPQTLSQQPAQPQPSTETEEDAAPEDRRQPPDAPSATTQQGQGEAASGQQRQPEVQRPPLGTAAAEEGVTYGGAASKPAGAAIAPAKQKQSRSLLIKLGAIAAGAVALGTIYALSKGSPSRPPGATTSTTTSPQR